MVWLTPGMVNAEFGKHKRFCKRRVRLAREASVNTSYHRVNTDTVNFTKNTFPSKRVVYQSDKLIYKKFTTKS